MFTINAQFLYKQLSCCPVRDYSENGADDKNENKCDIETAHVEPCSLAKLIADKVWVMEQEMH